MYRHRLDAALGLIYRHATFNGFTLANIINKNAVLQHGHSPLLIEIRPKVKRHSEVIMQQHTERVSRLAYRLAYGLKCLQTWGQHA